MTLRNDFGKWMSEADMMAEKFSTDRIKSVKRYCMTHAQWKYDLYEKDVIRYGVVTESSFNKKRKHVQAMSVNVKVAGESAINMLGDLRDPLEGLCEEADEAAGEKGEDGEGPAKSKAKGGARKAAAKSKAEKNHVQEVKPDAEKIKMEKDIQIKIAEIAKMELQIKNLWGVSECWT